MGNLDQGCETSEDQERPMSLSLSLVLLCTTKYFEMTIAGRDVSLNVMLLGAGVGGVCLFLRWRANREPQL